jgi:hypothetical protein
MDRILRRLLRLRKQLGATGPLDLDSPVPRKPEGMRKATYARLKQKVKQAQWELQEAEAESHLVQIRQNGSHGREILSAPPGSRSPGPCAIANRAHTREFRSILRIAAGAFYSLARYLEKV